MATDLKLGFFLLISSLVAWYSRWNFSLWTHLMTNILKNLIAFTLKQTVDDGSDVIWFDLFLLRMREMRRAID